MIKNFIKISIFSRCILGYKFAMMEMKTILALLLKNYKFSTDPGYEVEMTYRVTLRAKGGIWLNLKSIKDERNSN